MTYPDPRSRTGFQPIRDLAGPNWSPWAYCQDEQGCGHNVQLDIAAIVAKAGDMPADQFRLRLRCSRCGKRARLVIGHR